MTITWISNIKYIRFKPRLHDLVLAGVCAYGRHVARLCWAHAPSIHATSHADDEKRVAWVFICMHACGSVPIVRVLLFATLVAAATTHSSIKTHAFFPANHSSSFFLSPVNSVQVELALSGLDRHKATIDIPNYQIKIASTLLSTPFTNLFIESIESGIVSDVFKISKVTPVFNPLVPEGSPFDE